MNHIIETFRVRLPAATAAEIEERYRRAGTPTQKGFMIAIEPISTEGVLEVHVITEQFGNALKGVIALAKT